MSPAIKQQKIADLRIATNNVINKGKSPIAVKDVIAAIDLTKPLDTLFLSHFNHEELEEIKQGLVKRAAEVFGEIAELKARDDYQKKQFNLRLFNSEHACEITGEILFKYTCEARFKNLQRFVPGAWFQEFLDELDVLRERYKENSIAFPERQKGRLINQLTGAAQAKQIAA